MTSENEQITKVSARVLEDQRDEARFRVNILARALGGEPVYPVPARYKDLWESCEAMLSPPRDEPIHAHMEWRRWWTEERRVSSSAASEKHEAPDT